MLFLFVAKWQQTPQVLNIFFFFCYFFNRNVTITIEMSKMFNTFTLRLFVSAVDDIRVYLKYLFSEIVRIKLI